MKISEKFVLCFFGIDKFRTNHIPYHEESLLTYQKNMQRKFFLAAFSIIFLFVTFSVSASGVEQSPILIIEQIDGKNFDLGKLRGKVVLINFWASWCKDCHNEMPLLEEIYQTYHAKGLEVLSVSIDRKEDRKNVLKFSKKISYPIAILEEAKNSNFESPAIIPTVYFVNKVGKLEAKIIVDEKATRKDFEEILLPLLSQE